MHLNDAAVGHYMNGRRKPSYKACLNMAQTTGDYSIFKIAGYDLPASLPFSSLPPDLQDRFNSAMDELNKELAGRNITDENEAFKLASDFFASRSLKTTRIK